MSIESTVEAYESLLATYKEELIFGEDTDGYISQNGQYAAHVTVSRYQRPGNAQAVAVHTNPTVALLLAKAIAVSELVGEPTLPYYQDCQDVRLPTPGQQAVQAVTPTQQAAAAPAAPANNVDRPIVDPDGKVRCWNLVEGKECGKVIQEWDGKSPAELGASRRTRYGLIMCPKCIAVKKKAQG